MTAVAVVIAATAAAAVVVVDDVIRRLIDFESDPFSTASGHIDGLRAQEFESYSS